MLEWLVFGGVMWAIVKVVTGGDTQPNNSGYGNSGGAVGVADSNRMLPAATGNVPAPTEADYARAQEARFESALALGKIAQHMADGTPLSQEEMAGGETHLRRARLLLLNQDLKQ